MQHAAPADFMSVLMTLVGTPIGALVFTIGCVFVYLIMVDPKWNLSVLNFIRRRLGVKDIIDIEQKFDEVHDSLGAVQNHLKQHDDVLSEQNTQLELIQLRYDLWDLIEKSPDNEKLITEYYTRYSNLGGNGPTKKRYELWKEAREKKIAQ